LTNLIADETLRPMLPARKWPAAACSFISSTVTCPTGRASSFP
jgi:hypothetical protein